MSNFAIFAVGVIVSLIAGFGVLIGIVSVGYKK